MNDRTIVNLTLSLAAGLFATASFWVGHAIGTHDSRPPIIDGVQTWYEPARMIPGVGMSEPAMHHNVYPPSGKAWFQTHSVGVADCPRCEGKPATERDAK